MGANIIPDIICCGSRFITLPGNAKNGASFVLDRHSLQLLHKSEDLKVVSDGPPFGWNFYAATRVITSSSLRLRRGQII